MSDVWVKSFTHLKDRPHADRALQLLRQVASLVKPIMRSHGWVLPVLAEFFPDNPSLLGLNVNGGEQILVRLRPHWAPDTFLDTEDVVHTMLHELTHNVHGPHDNAFYSYLSKLEEEYSALKRSGYAGEGFFTPGHRLGGGTSRNVPPHVARLKALEAAERRRRAGEMLSGGGRLGGTSLGEQWLSPRELAARAAERRVRDEKSCGSHSGVDVQREAARAAQNGITTTTSSFNAGPNNIPGRDPRDPGPSGSGSHLTDTPPPPVPHSTRPQPQSNGSDGWSCQTCTLINPPLALQCEACLSSRPVDPAVAWSCMTCRQTGMPHEFWSCTFCGEIKRSGPVIQA